jgi:CheY-like chemotaxis protein
MKEAADVQPMTVLLVEDDPVTTKVVSTILGEAGYRIRFAADGLECLDSLDQVQPDVILMDIKMPKLGGIETCRKIQAHSGHSSIPVVFVTACTDDATLEAAFNAGGRDYIRKPINRVELLSRLRLMCELQQTHLKRLETEKLNGVLETAGGVCHKLNQPLQYILGAVQILLMDMDIEDKLYPQLDALRDKVEQMGEITRRLAEITRYRTRTHAGGQHILDIDDSSGHGHDADTQS